MKYTEIYKTVMQSYEGDNQITIGMREDFIHCFNECLGEKMNDPRYKSTLSLMLTKAMNARTFRGFDKVVTLFIDCVRFPSSELYTLVKKVEEWQHGTRRTCPI